MMSSKDLYFAEDEGMDWSDAYEATADAAWDAMRDRAADMADAARERSKAA